MKALRLCFSAPTAHYRIPYMQMGFRQSYPIPAYSTAVGLLMNAIGRQEDIDWFLQQPFGLFIAGGYGCITQEYVWHRNLLKERHQQRHTVLERPATGRRTEHIGGQSPVTVEVLNEVCVYLYVFHEEDRLELLAQRLQEPAVWRSHLSLGRSEDWAILATQRVVALSVADGSDYQWTQGWRGTGWLPEQVSGADVADDQRREGYSWLPAPHYAYQLSEWTTAEQYRALYDKNLASAMLVTALYEQKAASSGQSPIRNFLHVPAKLSTGSIPLIDDQLPRVLVDTELKKPVFPATVAFG